MIELLPCLEGLNVSGVKFPPRALQWFFFVLSFYFSWIIYPNLSQSLIARREGACTLSFHFHGGDRYLLLQEKVVLFHISYVFC